ncbi:serine/threonine-protein kinase 11-interacting protein-like [Scylla paramamosain]|uniref:serine/threonine-protein kinase 11-interacting protein-like n=1 Tax=Scylla paramamosain TaxID=85552 RepID=UPI003082E925
MNEDTLERLCRLAPALKQSAHLLLHHNHNLSLDTHTLMEMQQAFSLILDMEQHTNFHVLPPNHRQHPAIPHLQMLYDLLQKVAGLRLWCRQDHQQQQQQQQQGVVSLRCFRSLRTLELTSVPVARLRTLQALRSQLRRLVVTRGLSCLADLFVCCGADQAGEFVWEQLVEATLAHNALQGGTLDDSLRLLPNLKVLDVSHCGLHDVTSLTHLPALSYLDVSHNNLTHLPHLPPATSPSLVVLLASHNAIHTLQGLQVMTGLEEVNVGHNFIATRSGLVTLAALPRLRSLCVEGNPVCCDPAHRSAVLCLLHPATLPDQLLLDNHSLTQAEQELIGSISSPPDHLHSPISPSPLSPLLSLHTESSQPHQERETQPYPSLPHDTLTQAGAGPRRRSRKKRTTRHIALGGRGRRRRRRQGRVAPLPHSALPLPVHPPPPYLSAARRGSFLPSRRHPSPPPPSLAVGGPLTAPNGTLSEALAVLTPPPPIRSVQDHNDKLLEEILQAKPTLSSPPSPLLLLMMMMMVVARRRKRKRRRWR